MRSKRTIGILSAALVTFSAAAAVAAPKLRVQVDQRGDFVLLGNTLGHDCASGTPAPVVGTVGSCGSNTSDSAPDVFWRADSPSAGQAAANSSITLAQARSTAMLEIPAGAEITHAYLYWAAGIPSSRSADTEVTLERPGAGGFSQNVTAIESYTATGSSQKAYQSVADITDIVKAQGPGAYRVSGVDSAGLVNVNSETVFTGWWMTVFYRLDSDPPRNLALFDGLDVVARNSPTSATLSGFLVPNAGFNGKLGVVAFEGDSTISGDQFLFNGVVLSDAQNPANNFFNSSRSYLGAPVSNVGDLPQLTGTAGSLSGIDIDVVDITDRLTAGDTSATIRGTSSQDLYFLGGFVTSISTYRPDFTTSTKDVVDVNGGALLAGDILEYTIVVKNTGNDVSVDTVLTDKLPAGVTYVPGSLKILTGANAGDKTDAADVDQAEYDEATRTVTFRLGEGANGVSGGSLAVDASTTVSFQVTVNADASGTIANQAFVSASGELGAPEATTPTDGNGPDPGSPPTDIVIDECETNTDCDAATPYCRTDAHPFVCSADECSNDGHCGDATSGRVCDVDNAVCVDGCRGENGNGCPSDNTCTSTDDTIGICGEGTCTTDADCGDAKSGKVCNTDHRVCVDGCRGEDGNGCPTGEACSSTDGAIGVCEEGCRSDSDCGDATSGRVCDVDNRVCIDGCRGEDGNDCPDGETCTSADDTIGVCGVGACATDADCGGATSGKVCDDANKVCVDGCRGENGNGCPGDKTCSSTDDTIGVCGDDGDGSGGALDDDSGIFASGNGIACGIRNGASGSAAGLILGGAAVALFAARRRRRS